MQGTIKNLADVVVENAATVNAVLEDIQKGSIRDEYMDSSQPPTVAVGGQVGSDVFMEDFVDGDDHAESDNPREGLNPTGEEEPKGTDDKIDADAVVASGECEAEAATGEGAEALMSMSAEVGTGEGAAAVQLQPAGRVGVNEARRQIRSEMQLDPYSALLRMRRKPDKLSLIKIPLCRLLPCDFVRPAMLSDVQKLQTEFSNGIRPGSGAFYVAATSHMGEETLVTEEMKSSWCSVWHILNSMFEAELSKHEETRDLSGKMFYVFDGNHRTRAWRGFIDMEYPDDYDWAYANGRPDCILLEVKDSREALVTAMHAINK